MTEIDNHQILANLRLCVKKNEGNALRRVLKQPNRLLSSKWLEKKCLSTNQTQKIKASLFWGDEMIVVFPEIVSCFLYRYGFFEPDLTKLVITQLKPGDTFFDIGTHFGYYSLLASKLVGNNGRVHGFEPTMGTYEVVALNTETKNNIKLNNIAAWSTEETLTFTDYGVQWAAFNSLYGAKLPEAEVAKMSPFEYEIEAISIDKYIESTGARPNFIKIDAENAEYDILQGMQSTLANIRPIITMEVGDVNEGDFQNSNACVTYLVENKYKVMELSDVGLRPHDVKKRYTHTNLVFFPE